MNKKDNQNYRPRHAWKDAVDERCVPINNDYVPRHRGREDSTAKRPDPIPSDLLEKDAHYDENGHIVYTSEDGKPIKVIPESIDY